MEDEIVRNHQLFYKHYNRVIVVNITHLLSIKGLNTVYTIEPCDQRVLVSIDMLVVAIQHSN
jgi:hypothetical protein